MNIIILYMTDSNIMKRILYSSGDFEIKIDFHNLDRYGYTYSVLIIISVIFVLLSFSFFGKLVEETRDDEYTIKIS